MSKNISLINKIENAGLVGRGGGGFSVAKKWQAVKDSLKEKKFAYIIINGAEGEPGVKKDGFILSHYGEELINGVFLANEFLGDKKIKNIYFFLNHEYYKKYAAGLKSILSLKKYSRIESKIIFTIKSEKLSYISGEESALINLIEGKKVEPRLKPPYPASSGLFNMPTLINNTETFYNVSRVERNKFNGERFYTVNGDVKHRGVYLYSDEMTISEVLKKTNNIPSFEYFVQIGGEAAGEVLRSDQLDRPVEGAGSIMVYDLKKTDKNKLIKYWLNFYRNESCGNCTSCREGTHRLWELSNQKEIDFETFWDLISVLEEASFCGLGRSLPVPIRSYYLNILSILKK